MSVFVYVLQHVDVQHIVDRMIYTLYDLGRSSKPI